MGWAGREGKGGREGREERTVPPRSVNPGYGPGDGRGLQSVKIPLHSRV